ncbi:MAG TPA: serine hydrolase domain-containing protein [Thermoanaerobaculia bacterium]|jgi:CubicO group peptidase (beta-lactamase class C family)|nr:serine hydrolase domain-containing protein [Thermoanaerobaculia bacterium]
MRIRPRLLALLFLAGIAVLVAEPALAAETRNLASQVDAVFSPYAKPGSPGCALAVIQDGRIAYEKGYGLASLEQGVPITPQTVFDIGSTSKQFTAASVLLLAQEGKLSLDDDVHKYIPELPDYGTPVTLRHLLHHTSGIRDYINLMVFGGINVEDWTTDDDALAVLARQKKLDFKPGDEHSYSNSGYFLLSLVVKRASGKPLRQLAQERIFGPLGMTSTRYLDDHTEVVPRRAASYAPGEGGRFKVQTANWEQTGDGAVQTTVEDLAKWDQNFYTPKVGGSWLVEQLQTTGTLNSGEAITYARGLVVSRFRGLRRVAHGGAWAGYRAQLMRFPDQRFSVVTLCNLASSNPTLLAQQVAEIYLAGQLQTATPPPVPAKTTTAGPAGDLARYAGTFWGPATDTVHRVVARDGKLFLSRRSGEDYELVPAGEGRFEIRLPGSDPVVLLFPPAATGAPRELRITAPGEPTDVYREVQTVTLKPEELAAYAGTYTSEELDATWTIQAAAGHLVVRGKRGPSAPLESAFADAFLGPAGLMRFARDGQGKVTGFLVGAGRARDLRFIRAGS